MNEGGLTVWAGEEVTEMKRNARNERKWKEGKEYFTEVAILTPRQAWSYLTSTYACSSDDLKSGYDIRHAMEYIQLPRALEKREGSG